MGVITKIACLVPPKVLVNLYYTLINPYILYGNIVWTSNYDSRIKGLIILQKQAIRTITRDSYYAQTFLSFKKLKIMKFDKINRYLIGNFMYKCLPYIILCQIPLSFKDYVTKRSDEHDHFTRAIGQLSVQYARTNYRQFLITCRGLE